MNNPKIEFDDRMLSLGLARVSEAAAIASVSLIGRGDEKAADEAAVNAMREQLNLLDISGTVVIGEGERDEAPMLYIGEEVGTGNGPGVDIALDPLEGTTLTAKDMPNALTELQWGRRVPCCMRPMFTWKSWQSVPVLHQICYLLICRLMKESRYWRKQKIAIRMI